MKIIVTRAFFLNGEPQPVGTELDIEDRFARELIHNGKGKPADAEEVAPADHPTGRNRKNT